MSDWIDLTLDPDSGIESVRAHFKGHAYDPHWHDSFLIGITEQGVQQFNCRRKRHHSTPGKVFMLEPGELHDGDAPSAEGFTYSMLYLQPRWLERELRELFEHAPDDCLPGFADTLSGDVPLAASTFRAFQTVHGRELRIVRQAALDDLLAIADRLAARFPDLPLYFDLGELRGYHYHTGVVFAVFVPGVGQSIAQGGRYDDIGADFGRARPATGFSTDLKTLVTLGRAEVVLPAGGIWTPDSSDAALWQMVCQLRHEGQRVVQALPGQPLSAAREADCDRQLIQQDGRWQVLPLTY